MMDLNKALWQQAQKYYRDWNEAKFREHVQSAKKSPAEKWADYQQLYAFGRKLKPEPSLWEQKTASQEWDAYYLNIRRFEEWRKDHGSKT
jgi:hypothetical protein